jgi:hypothetical protein
MTIAIGRSAGSTRDVNVRSAKPASGAANMSATSATNIMAVAMRSMNALKGAAAKEAASKLV